MPFPLARLRTAEIVRAAILLGCAAILSACGPEGAGTVDMSKARQAKAAPAPPPAAKTKAPAGTKAPAAKAPANPSERLSAPGQRSGRPPG
jgi:hypothetical protein